MREAVRDCLRAGRKEEGAKVTRIKETENNIKRQDREREAY